MSEAQDEIPLYELEADAFLNQSLLKTGTRIRWNGPYGPHMIPLNAAAEARRDDYFANHPSAKNALNPVEELSLTVEQPLQQTKPVEVDLTTTIPGAAVSPAQPGPTEKGGKV